MLYRLISFFSVFLMLAACGAETTPKDNSTTKDAGNTDSSSSSSATTAKEAAAPAVRGDAARPNTAGGYLQGYVASAFDMEVNGAHYTDSEDFYSHEMDDLASQVQAAGYGGYSMKFDAQIGLDDLKYGMKVYVAATGSTGYAGDTTVNEKGRFVLSIPDGNGDQTFRVRTNKRVSVILTKGQDTVRWCYNFSSADVEASLDAAVIISSFTTSLTKYACDNGAIGMQIPQNPDIPVAEKTAAPAAKDPELTVLSSSNKGE